MSVNSNRTRPTLLEQGTTMSSQPKPRRRNTKETPGRNPSAKEILAKREEYSLTQTKAGALVYTPLRTWQDWEYGHRRMPAALWEYFCLVLDYPTVAKARADWLEHRAA